MRNDREIIEIEVSVAESADISIKAAKVGMSTKEYAGIQCLQGVYGIFHPLVAAFHKRTKHAVIGTKTQGEEK